MSLDEQLFAEWNRLEVVRRRLALEAMFLIREDGAVGQQANHLVTDFATYLRELGALERLIDTDASRL